MVNSPYPGDALMSLIAVLFAMNAAFRGIVPHWRGKARFTAQQYVMSAVTVLFPLAIIFAHHRLLEVEAITGFRVPSE